MPLPEVPAGGRGSRPAPQAAALAALSISESLILALVESGTLDAHVVRRCLLDAAAGYDQAVGAGEESTVESQASGLIGNLLQQIEAVAPSASDAAMPPASAS